MDIPSRDGRVERLHGPPPPLVIYNRAVRHHLRKYGTTSTSVPYLRPRRGLFGKGTVRTYTRRVTSYSVRLVLRCPRTLTSMMTAPFAKTGQLVPFRATALPRSPVLWPVDRGVCPMPCVLLGLCAVRPRDAVSSEGPRGQLGATDVDPVGRYGMCVRKYAGVANYMDARFRNGQCVRAPREVLFFLSPSLSLSFSPTCICKNYDDLHGALRTTIRTLQYGVRTYVGRSCSLNDVDALPYCTYALYVCTYVCTCVAWSTQLVRHNVQVLLPGLPGLP